MKPLELSKYMRDKISRSCICGICGGTIHDSDDIIYNRYREGRNIMYHFYHSDCAKGEILKQIKYFTCNVMKGEVYGEETKHTTGHKSQKKGKFLHF